AMVAIAVTVSERDPRPVRRETRIPDDAVLRNLRPPEHLGRATVGADGEQGAVVAGESFPSGQAREHDARPVGRNRRASWSSRSDDLVEPRELLGDLRLRTIGVQDEQVLIALLDEYAGAVQGAPENRGVQLDARRGITPIASVITA